MADSPAINRAARIIADVRHGEAADAALKRHLTGETTLHASSKRSVSRAFFTYYRWLPWLDQEATLQKQLMQAVDLQGRFERSQASVKPEALAARAVPGWLKGEMDLSTEFLRHLQTEPWLWIRGRPKQARALANSLSDCEAAETPFGKAATEALRYKGSQDLFRTEAFHKGDFEIQDIASQLVGVACAPEKKQTWWDACAGEGGKTLHIADLMANTGLVWSSDRSMRRLDVLKRRAARAGLFNYRSARWEGGKVLPTKTMFDGILIDAPCSGVGTWLRNPHARWTTTIEDVKELALVQKGMLEAAAGSVKPGGKLVYSVCTLTRSETKDVADGFEATHPEFVPEVIAFAQAPRVTLWPQEIHGNGMFIASWRRKA